MHQAQLNLPPLSLNAWLRYDFIERILAGLEGVGRVLEVGTGQGAIGARLASRYDYTGVEPDLDSFAVARKRLERVGRGRMVNGFVSDLPADATFDLVCAFEVLEHIEDDVAALREWGARVRPGGYAMISSPAFPDRFGPFDHFAGHFRRYDRQQFADLLTAAGFEEPSVFTYGALLGQLLETIRHRVTARKASPVSMEERTAASGRWMHPDRLGWLTHAASAPFRVLQRPFANGNVGTGFVAVARRAGPS
ncbi:MAG TPA: class I SAM-dependent methyltransferase [Actinomycetota bacterium]|nr:class I SAM-dependent methyltransferase [Actinomycetota bacterium]